MLMITAVASVAVTQLNSKLPESQRIQENPLNFQKDTPAPEMVPSLESGSADF